MKEKTLHQISIILAIVAIVIVSLWGWIIIKRLDAVEDYQTMQFGGKQNAQLAKQLFLSDKYSQGQKQQLETAIAQLSWSAPTAQQPQQDATAAQGGQQANAFPSGKLTSDQLAALKKNAFVEWDANAKVTIVEYSDPECPFCIRHFNDKTITNAVAAFPGKVNHIFKVVQGVNHPGTEYKSLAILCAGKLWWQQAFVDMYTAILWHSSPSAAIATGDIAGYAKSLKIDASKLASCINAGDMKSIYASNWAEFQTFTSQPGTPGNIVINNESGEWKLVAWAFPVATFQQIIGDRIK